MADDGGRMSVARLRELVNDGAVDTVALAVTDLQGRLQGKRCSARWFLEEVLKHGAEACNYLLAVDVEMNTVGGYALASWEQGYGDFELVPDLQTLTVLPWQERSALVHCDLRWSDGAPVDQAPRQVLRRQVDRLAERGLVAYAGTELEFLLFENSFEQGWKDTYRTLVPASRYNVDYSLFGVATSSPVLDVICRGMEGAGLYVESVKGECNRGQYEIAFRYDEVVRTCDNHALYKTGAKEIAHQLGRSLTFMAKFDQREGNSCHVHLSLRSADGDPVLSGSGTYGFSPLMEHFLAGQLAALRDFTLLLAPNINSYKRYVAASFAPTTVAWGVDNRTCALRVVGSGQSLRVENRVPGGDVNPYLALAALIAAGLYGIERELPLEPASMGNAYTQTRPRVPSSLAEARELFANSAIAKEAFGEDVVAHYLNAADVELAAFGAAVTDWERVRGFERL